MGGISCSNSITIEFDCQFSVEMANSSLVTVLAAFCKLLPQILTDFIQKVLIGFGEYAMVQFRKPFCCERYGNDKEFIWKTRHGRKRRY
ncbi:MAG: hypothetical protein U0586_03445 [Candidatus Brocadiaceae bacterium]